MLGQPEVAGWERSGLMVRPVFKEVSARLHYLLLFLGPDDLPVSRKSSDHGCRGFTLNSALRPHFVTQVTVSAPSRWGASRLRPTFWASDGVTFQPGDDFMGQSPASSRETAAALGLGSCSLRCVHPHTGQPSLLTGQNLLLLAGLASLAPLFLAARQPDPSFLLGLSTCSPLVSSVDLHPSARCAGCCGCGTCKSGAAWPVLEKSHSEPSGVQW